ALPANLEVQEALQAYLQLYGGEEHRENLGRMRAAAAEAMRFLDPLRSRLVGAVLDGTDGRHARITLHVFCDGPDAIIHHLMERNVPFRQEQRQIRWHDGAHRILPLAVVDREPFTIEMMIFDELQLRQALVDADPQGRLALGHVVVELPLGGDDAGRLGGDFALDLLQLPDMARGKVLRSHLKYLRASRCP
ncbi:MAG TPA: hypothetical protein VLS27_00930, partial [Gammaproteobacteria bacterium]|nr:hypothetical protein [Gammaproteobacteria bacterium]